MMQPDQTRRLQIFGDQALDMPLRVLNLILQLGLSADHIVIERGPEGQTIEAVLQVSDDRGYVLVEKIRAMVAVWSANWSEP